MMIQNAELARTNNDEIMIDLAKYARILAAGWRTGLALSLIGALLGLGFSYVFPPPYEAVAGVAMVKTRTNVEFDTKIITTGPDSSPQTMGSADGRRAALVGLALNGTIAQNLSKQFGSRLADGDREPGALLRKVTSDAGTGNRSELISIRVRDVDAQLATDLANAWAIEYEKVANGVFGSASGDYGNTIQSQFEQAERKLTMGQNELEAYLAKSNIDQLSRQLSETLSMLSTLQRDRQSAVFNAQFDAMTEAQIAQLREQGSAELQVLRNLYEARVRTLGMRDEATAMRNQVRAGGDGAASSNALALILLKSRVFGQKLDQLQLGQIPTSSAQAQLADLDGLVSALDTRVADLDTSIAKQSKAISEERMTIADSVLPARVMATPKAMSDAEAAVISRLQAEVSGAQAKIETQKAQQMKLTQARDLARSTYNTLASKREEISIAAAVTGSEVRFASPAVAPTARTQSRGVYGAVGLALGLLAGLGMVGLRRWGD